MTHPRLRSLALILAMSLGGGLAQAQENNSPSASAAIDQELKDKAFRLLESVGGQLGTLQSTENRARIGSNLAGSLWSHDETRARALLRLVESDINSELQNIASDDERDTHTILVFLKLRIDTVERIAKYDAEEALAFLKATEFKSTKRLPYGIAENERALELRLAKNITATNPDLALKLGLQSLERGFSSELVGLLTQLNKRNKEAALSLYKEIVAKLRNRKLMGDWPAFYFARELAQSFTPPAADYSTFRDLLNVFTSSASENGCGNKTSIDPNKAGFCGIITGLVSQMERFNPSQSAQQRQSTEFDHEDLSELIGVSGNGSVDDILAQLAKYPHLESEIYRRASLKAIATGDLERARKIANDHIPDVESRRMVLTQIERYQAWAAASEEALAELESTLNSIPTARERVTYLITMSKRIGVANPKTAVRLLNQANEMVATMKPGREQTQAQIALARLYCLEKSDRGFAIMETVLPKLNELVAAAIKLDGFDNRYVRDGEWNMTGEGGVGDLLTLLANSAGYFAWCDFERAMRLTGQFDRPEIRMMAQLKLAQGILAGPPKREQIYQFFTH